MSLLPLATSHASSAGSTLAPAHTVVHRDPFAYCSHPSALRLADGTWLIAFLETMRRPEVHHSPADPRFLTLLTRSRDRGRTWSRPAVVPGFDWYGVECPSLTQLADGDLLLLQWRWRWSPWSTAAGERSPDLYERADTPWRRGNDGTYVHRSPDGGLSWEVGERVDTGPYPGAYTMRSAVALADGTLLFAVSSGVERAHSVLRGAVGLGPSGPPPSQRVSD